MLASSEAAQPAARRHSALPFEWAVRKQALNDSWFLGIKLIPALEPVIFISIFKIKFKMLGCVNTYLKNKY